MKTAFVALLSVVLYLAGPQPVQAAAVWLDHPETAFAEAKRSGKVVLVDLYADWCGWCKVMERDVFSTPEFQTYAERFVLLRPGGLPRERIEERLGEKLALRTEGGQAPEAPGQLASHYAPVRPLSLVDSVNEVDYSDGTPIGVLTWRPLVADLPSHVEVRTLSIDGSTEAGARQLFAQLRALDRPPHARLYAERCPTDEGLGYAINDRLRRAAAR